MDYDLIARDFLRALRGPRSQVAWSRRLGYRSNVAYAWESGRRWPTAAEALRACGRAGIDLDRAMERFFGRPAPWQGQLEHHSPEAAAAMLRDLQGQATVTDLARRAQLSRYRVLRWLAGQTEPRLPDFLRLIEAASVRMVDLVAALVDPERVPSVTPLWRQLEARRHGAGRHPWSQAVLRTLELASYRALPQHDDTWLAEQLAIPVSEVQACIELLEQTGAIRWKGKRWRPEPLAVDTRRHPEVGRKLKQHWTAVAAERIGAEAPGQFSYNVFAVSAADFDRIRELHLAYFHALRQIVASSSGDEIVAVANVQLFPLTGKPAP